jgi:penicillin-binding protein 1C
MTTFTTNVRQWFIALAGLGLFFLGWLFGYSGPIGPTDPSGQSGITYASYITDSQGELLHVLMADDERYRLQTQPKDVDPTFIDLLLAYEDQRYYQHHGVDWLAMARASWQLASQGYIVSGGSTLTMQAVRLMEPKPRTVWNKLDQMRKAIALERSHTKDQILSLYLSLAPYGSNIEGVQMASLSWFGKWANELTPAESALLVALPQSPERRRPDRFPNRADEARQIVLERALQKGIINKDYLTTALLSPLPQRIKTMPKMAPHLAYQLRAQGDLQASTTLNAEYQSTLNAIASQTRLKPNTNIAMLLANAKTGEIHAYVGSQRYTDFDKHGAVDYSKAVRSPGSTLKPFIYAQAASKRLIHLSGIIKDERINIQGYQPQNLNRRFYGDITIGEALQRSLNIPAVKVLQKLGPERFKSKLAQANIPLRQGEGLPIALGGAGLTLHELVSLYTALGNAGKVTNVSATNTIENTSHNIFGADQIAQINHLLSNNTAGAGRLHGRIKRQAIAYKTGTGPGGSDAWAIGTNGDYVVGIWVGSPKGEHVASNTGLGEAVPVMNRVFDGLPVGQLAQQPPQAAPEALANMDKTRNGLVVRFPVEGSVIEVSQSGAPVPIILENASYPVLVLTNDRASHLLTVSHTNLAFDTRGTYKVSLVDRLGKAATVEFMLR